MTDMLKVRGLVKHYDTRRGLFGKMTGNPGTLVQAVSGVDITIQQGKTLGLIGESGCGKSTLGRAILRLHEPTSGAIEFDGVNVINLDAEAMKEMRQKMQIIFQDPYASLNPRKTVRQIIGQPLKIHGKVSDAEVDERVKEMMERVGLKVNHMNRYPHQFSGGQRQRIGIARALILNPKFVVCDEPVSALDVSIQAQIIELLADLKRELGLTYLFISHDISVIGYVSERIAVMYLGKIVEEGDTHTILKSPIHPYTQALLSSVPQVESTGATKDRIRLTGDLPSPVDPPKGCKFHTRCQYASEICKTVEPAYQSIEGTHSVACHLVGDDA
jgi:oligopeptide/dipeptide ABC transporter ATP-binding protein